MASAAPGARDDSRFVLMVGGGVQTAEGHRSLVDTRVIHADDQLVLMLTATRAVSVFVAYCDSEAKQQVYGPLEAGPGWTLEVPQGGSLVADSHPGREHVFVVASAAPLQRSDARLDRILRSENAEHACEDNLAMTTRESRSQPARSESAPTPPQARTNAALPSPRRPSNYPTAAGWSRVRGFNVRHNASPAHTTPTIATQSDDYGIAIVVFTFDHQ